MPRLICVISLSAEVNLLVMSCSGSKPTSTVNHFIFGCSLFHNFIIVDLYGEI